MRNKERYGEKWTDEIRPRILKRDNYKCIDCQVQHRKYVLYDSRGKYTYIEKDECTEYKQHNATAYRIFLQISHKDHNPKNMNDDNLYSRCVRCHLRFDREHKKLMSMAKKQSGKLSVINDIGAIQIPSGLRPL